jgi:sterol desaturase/sphingolipid hydroxylase (fatty acid hydroxylase superfamily)
VLWGPSLSAFMIFEAGITAYSQFHHSDIDFPDAVEEKLRWIHMTPRVHASHHTVSLRTRDANYSTIFSLWDRVFGTFQEPDSQEIKQLGLPEGREDVLSYKKMFGIPFSR